MRACMSKCFESELQDKTRPFSHQTTGREMDPLILFFCSRCPVGSRDATVKHVKDSLSLFLPSPPLLPLPLSAPQPGMMREGTAERGQGESEGEKGEVEVEVDSPS